MVQRLLLRGLLWGILSSMLLACSKPTLLAITPQVETSASDIGRDRPVFLEVVDRRDSEQQVNLEQRGIAGPDHNLPLVLKKIVRVGLFNMGFTTARMPEAGVLRLTVYLDDLDYTTTDAAVLPQIFLFNQLQFEVQRSDGTFQFRYSTEQNHQLAMSPSMSKQRQLVADVLSDSLQRALNDQTFLAQISRDL